MGTAAAHIGPGPSDLLDRYDLVVLGAGAGGMAAAAVAAGEGLRVLLLEKAPVVGGTTAISGGMVWVPDNHLMHAHGLADSRDAARAYLTATVPAASARGAIETYLAAAPEAIRYFTERTEVKLRPVLRYPDYYPARPGSTLGGRVLEPEPFDGARLGPAFAWLRPPLEEFTIFGGMMVARADLPHFRRFARSPRSALRVASLLLRHGVQRLRHPRGTALVLGNALVARLLYACLEAGVTLARSADVRALLVEQKHCRGVRAVIGGAERTIEATRGVVVATGGFSHDAARRRALMPGVADEISATVDCAVGDGLGLATAAGAGTRAEGPDPAFWVPVSTYVTRSGRRVVYPHTVTDRAKPGAIAVDLAGRRFVNEAVSYHEFVRAMLRSPNGSARRAWLVCDSRFIWKYGLGAITPFTLRLAPYVDAGYLKTAPDIPTLAERIGVPGGALTETVARFNADAAKGEDPEFGRGGDDYQRHLGDGDHKPNPCVAPIRAPPYYAVELRPGDLGTASGIAVDAGARVLDAGGAPIAGLWAAGNDAASIMEGNYPGPGITLGPALVFGWLAAMDAAGRRRPSA